jgi:hypothetical protein
LIASNWLYSSLKSFASHLGFVFKERYPGVFSIGLRKFTVDVFRLGRLFVFARLFCEKPVILSSITKKIKIAFFIQGGLINKLDTSYKVVRIF